MNLKAKRYEEERKKKVQEKLKARLALLEGRGMEPGKREKDTVVRKLRAEIRKVISRLLSIAAMEKINSRKIEKKQEKEAAEKQARESGEAKPAKKKKAAKPKAAKKEKKAKEEAPAPAEEQD